MRFRLCAVAAGLSLAQAGVLAWGAATSRDRCVDVANQPRLGSMLYDCSGWDPVWWEAGLAAVALLGVGVWWALARWAVLWGRLRPPRPVRALAGAAVLAVYGFAVALPLDSIRNGVGHIEFVPSIRVAGGALDVLHILLFAATGVAAAVLVWRLGRSVQGSAGERPPPG